MCRLCRYLALCFYYVVISVQASPGQAMEASGVQSVYVPVVPFPTIVDDIKWADVQRYWQGDATALVAIGGYNAAGKGQSLEFVTTPTILSYLTGLLGTPAP